VNVVDSSAWLEYFAGGANAGFFAPAIEDPGALIVPAVTLVEVFKRILQQRSEGDALRAIAVMRQGRVVDLDAPLALAAAKLGVEARLPLADSIILATTQLFGATLWTQDDDFEDMPMAKYRAKRR